MICGITVEQVPTAESWQQRPKAMRLLLGLVSLQTFHAMAWVSRWKPPESPQRQKLFLSDSLSSSTDQASSLREDSTARRSPTDAGRTGRHERRSFLATLAVGSWSLGGNTARAADAPRQLELCLVSVLRVTYWAQGLAYRIKAAADDPVRQRQAYLEARTGAKAILTGGKGLLAGTPNDPTASRNVYMLSTLQLPGCLRDLQQLYPQQQKRQSTSAAFDTTCRDFYEALASLVEFDGMDTLQDPSPRSSLTLSQCTDKKLLYVQRLLQERIVPLGHAIVGSFAVTAQQTSRDYVQRYHANELPPPPPSPPLAESSLGATGGDAP